MSDFKERVIQEKKELQDKITKLENFLYSDKSKDLEVEDRELLRVQLFYMQQYRYALRDRIVRFK